MAFSKVPRLAAAFESGEARKPDRAPPAHMGSETLPRKAAICSVFKESSNLTVWARGPVGGDTAAAAGGRQDLLTAILNGDLTPLR